VQEPVVSATERDQILGRVRPAFGNRFLVMQINPSFRAADLALVEIA
jgi:hypothetical protein